MCASSNEWSFISFLFVLQNAHADKLVKVKDIVRRQRDFAFVSVKFLDGTALPGVKRVVGRVNKGDILTLHGKCGALTLKSVP